MVIRSVAWMFLVSGCFYISEAERADRWDLDGDGLERPDDCDDDDPLLGPETIWYADTDEDGAGDPLTPIQWCGQPPGRVANADDCDDTDPSSHPGGQERCDDRDNDCDLSVDEDLAELTWYADTDGDGYGDEHATEEDCAMPDGYVAIAGDCDDGEFAVNPDGVEVCGGDANGVDEDCDELIDEEDPDVEPPLWFTDDDMDGHGAGNGIVSCEQPPGTSSVDDDCDDEDASVDEGWTYYEDLDGDGFGNAGVVSVSCQGPPLVGWALMPGDCDDQDEEIVPPC